jgi:hypothetical protein
MMTRPIRAALIAVALAPLPRRWAARRAQRPAGCGGPDEGVAVAILQADATGHRLFYVRHLVEALGPSRCVVFLTDRGARSEEFVEHAEAMGASTRVLAADGGHGALLREALDSARAVGARKLLLPDGDRYLLPLLLSRARRRGHSVEIRLLLMRTTTRGANRLRPAMFIKPAIVQLLRACPGVRILFLTDALGVVTRRPGFPGIPPVADPVSNPGQRVRPRPSWFPVDQPNIRTVGVFGVVGPRKNLPLLVDAAMRRPGTNLVVGGRLWPQVRAFLQTSAAAQVLLREGRLAVADRRLGSAELDEALANVDLVAVLHDNDAPSGILAEACVRHTPVLVPTGGWLAEVVAAAGVGVASDLTADAVAAAIRELDRDHASFVAAARRAASRIGLADFTKGLLGLVGGGS